jgi:hypothetical protein
LTWSKCEHQHQQQGLKQNLHSIIYFVIIIKNKSGKLNDSSTNNQHPMCSRSSTKNKRQKIYYNIGILSEPILLRRDRFPHDGTYKLTDGCGIGATILATQKKTKQEY